MVTRSIAEIRRDNARIAVDRFGGVGKVAKAIGQNSPSFLVQCLGPNPTRGVTEALARKIEKGIGLAPRSLDREDELPAAAPASQPAAVVSTDLIASVIRLVGQVAEGEKVNLGPAKFADIVALTYTDSIEHQGVTRVDHVKALVRLLK